MTINARVLPGVANEEAEALIETLHATGRRLEEITGGEVDAVVGRDGAAFLLQRAQEELRVREATRQAVILNVLPAHIALIDNVGGIISVNRAWEKFADANGLFGPDHGIGTNYLTVCDRSRDGSEAAKGIRSVLDGSSTDFCIEYPCHSATQERWFMMTVTPLSDIESSGAVISHFNITEEHRAKRDLLASELKFRQMAESVGDVFTLREWPSREIIYVNPAYETIWGLSCASLYARPDSWLDVIHPDDVSSQKWKEGSEVTLPHVAQDFRIVRPDGETRWIEARRFPVHDDAGRLVRIATIATDITRRKQAELGMKRLNRVYALLSEINALFVRVKDRDELFRETCRIAVEHGGFRVAMIGTVDRTTNKLVPVASAGTDEAFKVFVRNLVPSDATTSTTIFSKAIRDQTAIVSNDPISDARIPFGETCEQAGVRSLVVLPLIVSAQAIGILALYSVEKDFFHVEEMKLLTELAEDVAVATDHIDRQERLDYLASYDQLTGLANRRLFVERFSLRTPNAIKSAQRLGVFLIDLERFKNLNDSLGQLAGDALLQQVAHWLTQYVGDATGVSRIAADQFAVTLPEEGTPGDVVRQLDAMVEAFLLHPFLIDGDVYRIAAKFGVAIFPDDGADADSLLKNAEAALKRAKAGGHRQLFYAAKMTETVARQLNLENQLRHALEKNEFVLHYQPKVNLATGEVTSVEALIRWNDPRSGLVPPGLFIPILEETGMIYEVGRWALHQARADHLRWRTAGLRAVRIAVNVSPLQLRHPGFIPMVENLVSADAHAADGLELEITEGAIMDDMKLAFSSLHAIRALGLSIAIDDFGTGFSSLGYLSKLPIDTLKIDRMFVTEMTADPKDLSLVSTIITLAHSLQLKVVAEGVETDEQANLLRLLKCNEMQGYLFSKPLPVDVLEAKFLAPIPPAG